ncbi:RBBP9/YdeN family alpha/beta hydrolase [Aureivirga marina]|uniref:RBBP9/YdeN family alpha/beta hydrolase n=1 Tax=Aureivirga marina TaxID=1182451 RepID=UPI0018CAA566|nr:alpha/beta fold hydrolase [Aureivirga marina]
MKEEKQKIYLIHGYTANPNANWFPHFKKELEKENFEVIIPSMPNSQAPKLKEWEKHLNNEIQYLDEKTILIGHSLGCVSLLHYLNQKNTKIHSLYLISGFTEKTPIPELQEFVEIDLDYKKIKKSCSKIISISAKDDDIISFKFSEELAIKLESSFHLLNEGKHFIDQDGFTKFPFLIGKIKENK